MDKKFIAKGQQYIVKITKDASELQSLYKLRYEVFSLEKGDYRYANIEEHTFTDRLDNANHLFFVMKKGNEVVGGTRLALRRKEELIGEEYYNFKALAEYLKIPLSEVIESTAVIQRTIIKKEHRNIGLRSGIYSLILDYCAKNDIKILLVVVKSHEEEIIASWLKKGWKIFIPLRTVDGIDFMFLMKKLYD